VSSSTADADIFAVLRVSIPIGKEVSFQGALDPKTPIGQGWLRASHRKPRFPAPRCLTGLPHPRREAAARAREVVELDVEIWPTCIVVPKGWRIALTVRRKTTITAARRLRLTT